MLRAYAQLLRLPNVFTAMADICLGWLVVQELSAIGYQPSTIVILCLLSAASACLYSAGMALNDYFDVEQDRRERPFRPIPSGRITRRTAGLLGVSLLLAGVGFAVICSMMLGWQPLIVAGPLAVCIVLYDGWLKRHWAGPLGMGLCRFLNVLLGFSATGTWPEPWMLYIAGVVGVYVVGVTWFARKEADVSRPSQLMLALAVVIIALMLAALVPLSPISWKPWRTVREAEFYLYPASMLMLAWMLRFPEATAAIRDRQPARVQAAVKRFILGIIGLDAVLAVALVGWPGLWIWMLLPPALLLGRRLYST